MTPYDKWFLEVIGRNERPNIEIVRYHVDAVIENQAIGETDIFRKMTVHYCISVALEISAKLSYGRKPLRTALFGAQTMVLLSILTPHARIDLDNLMDLVSKTQFKDISTGREFIKLIKVLMLHKVLWPKIKLVVIQAVERMLVELNLSNYLPISNTRSISRALTASEKKYRLLENAYRPDVE